MRAQRRAEIAVLPLICFPKAVVWPDQSGGIDAGKASPPGLSGVTLIAAQARSKVWCRRAATFFQARAPQSMRLERVASE
jgi:hypothetical protein